MEATLPCDVKLPFGVNLKEGDWFEICDFELTYAAGLIRPTKNKYKIILTEKQCLPTFVLSQSLHFFAVVITKPSSVVYRIPSSVLVCEHLITNFNFFKVHLF